MSRKGSTSSMSSSVRGSVSKDRETMKDKLEVESWICESCKKIFREKKST